MMKKIGLIFLSLAFLSCSKVGVGYSIGTHQIQNRVDDAFDFPRAKSKEVDRYLSAEFDKNKKTVFKKLKELLFKMEALAQKENPTQVEKDQLHQYLKDYQKEMITLFKPSFDKVIQEVGDSEINNFKEYSAEQITEKKEEALDKKSFKKKKTTNLKRVAEFLLGDLSKEQEQLVIKFVDEHVEFYVEQIDMRKLFNDDLVKLYPQKDKMTDLSLAYYSGDNSIRTDDYKKLRSTFELEMKNFIFALWDQKTDEQKQFFQKRVKDISSEVDKILIE